MLPRSEYRAEFSRAWYDSAGIFVTFALTLAPEAANPVAERFRLSHVHGSRVRFKPDGADLGLRTGERVTAG